MQIVPYLRAVKAKPGPAVLPHWSPISIRHLSAVCMSEQPENATGCATRKPFLTGHLDTRENHRNYRFQWLVLKIAVTKANCEHKVGVVYRMDANRQ